MPTPVKIPAHVAQIQDHGRRTYTLILEPQGRVPNYRPGQFTHLALDSYDPSSFWPESRVFSIATGPARCQKLRLTYTVVGAFTGRMEAELSPGRVVWLKLPYGDFTLQEDAGRETVLIAGGTGFTPFASFLEHLLDTGSRLPLRLAYGAAEARLLIYRDLVEEAASQWLDLRRLYFVEAGGVNDLIAGRISLDRVLMIVDHPKEAVFYLSGPNAMIDAFRSELLARKISAPAIRVDAWE